MFRDDPALQTDLLAFSQVQEQVADLEVSRGDFIALQHNSGPWGLLECSTNHSSPWRQSILALNHSNWFNDTIDITEDATWIHEALCPIRVLYTGMVDLPIPGQLLQRGLPDPGVYSFEVTSDDPDFPSQASCNISVVPPMALTVVYPPSQNGTIYFPINQTFLLARIRSWHEALASWQGGNQNFSFHPHCPPELESVVEECQSNPHNDTLFAYMEIPLGDSPPPALVIIAHSKVTSTNVTVRVKVEVPLRGLKIVPHPNQRVLMNTLVVSHLTFPYYSLSSYLSALQSFTFRLFHSFHDLLIDCSRCDPCRVTWRQWKKDQTQPSSGQ